ncbi:MAG: HEAT repeat domain-containing protein [Armatimonadota bacterium]
MLRKCLATAFLAAAISPAARTAQPKAPRFEEPPIVRPGDAHRPRLPFTIRGHTDWLPTLYEGFRSEDAVVRARCAFIAGQVGNLSAADELRVLLKDPDRDVRAQAGVALGYLGDEKATGAAAAVLVDGPGWRRVYAAHALAKIGTPRALALLKRNREKQPPMVAETIDAILAPDGQKPESRGWEVEDAPIEVGDAKPPPMKVGTVIDAAVDHLWRLVDVYWHEGKHEQCIRLDLTIAFLDPTFIEAYSTAGWLAWSAGRGDEGLRIYLDGLHANPNQYDMYYEVAFHYFNIRQWTTAARYFRKATEFECPDYVPRMLAHSLERAGRLEEAYAVWEDLLKKTPDNQIVIINHDRVKKLLADE